MAEKGSINWKQIILTGVVTLVVTISSSFIINFVQTKAPNLSYSVQDTLPFQGGDQTLGIYHVVLENDGGTLVRNVVFNVKINDALISNWKTSVDKQIPYDYSINNDTIVLTFVTLNPSEKVELSILATTKTILPNKPEVSVRGEGVIGSVKETTSTIQTSTYFLPLLIGVTFSSLLLFFKDKYTPKKIGPITLTSSMPEKHTAEQKDVFLYLCGIFELPEQRDYYIEKDYSVSYWGESDRLTYVAINNKDKKKTIQITKLLEALIIYAEINKESVGIVYFNISKLYGSIQQYDKMKINLEKAKQISPKLIEVRLSLDTFYQKLLEESKK